jgi:glucokinase
MMDNYVIGIDLGGTNLRVGAVTQQGEILEKVETSSEVHKGRGRVVELLLDALKEVRKSLQGIQLSTVGLGIPGVINLAEGIVVQSPNFPDWIDFNLKACLEGNLDVPLWIENDANAAALGELWLGAGKEHKNFCCLTLGTGVGGGIIVDGKILHGADGMAGEIGHIVVDPEGPPCGCGSYGCLEVYASATGLIRMAVGADLKTAPTAKDLHILAEKGNLEARRIFTQMGYYLGIGLTTLIQLLNVELIILGGGVVDSWDYFVPEAEKQIQKRAYKTLARRVKIRRALCGGDAGILGAAYVALQGLKELEERRRFSDERPWGKWVLLDEGPTYKVKRLEVKPGQRLSLQKHKHRAEHWVAVQEGIAEITLNGEQKTLSPNEYTFIPQEGIHRITNPGTKPVVIIEIQYGSYLGEDDITRLQDDYGRTS